MDQDSDKVLVPCSGDETNCNMGAIRINNDVVANIVRLSALGVNGVVDVGGTSVASRLSKIFGKNRSYSGVGVSEDASGNYVIDVQVILRFGIELAKVALDIQQNVAEKVLEMTMKSVSQVNVTIEKVVQDRDGDVGPGQQNTDYAAN
ncbi:MAG: Asp23/Gls24 family envelope stress response protein [Puniceicoccales bacterium]|jgi:uncharacterized alkaline shock family protein YloU|nr:Asp23/Gls24 family envelope stress response protein [Puniceicoccales bacterium]